MTNASADCHLYCCFVLLYTLADGISADDEQTLDPCKCCWQGCRIGKVSAAHHDLYDWWHSVVTGPLQRRSVVIIALDASGQPAVRWHILRAWPRLYRVSPFDATSDAILCETLELACEGVERA